VRPSISPLHAESIAAVTVARRRPSTCTRDFFWLTAHRRGANYARLRLRRNITDQYHDLGFVDRPNDLAGKKITGDHIPGAHCRSATNPVRPCSREHFSRNGANQPVSGDPGRTCRGLEFRLSAPMDF
jgi:hypothetical protein